jgi:uncharacterized membrane protein YeaQ/YmgE (transglycosylase-associated protein family)
VPSRTGSKREAHAAMTGSAPLAIVFCVFMIEDAIISCGHRNVFAKSQSMTLTDILLLLLIAGVCGGVARVITGFSRDGCLISILLGFIGAFLGNFLQEAIRLPEPFLLQIGNTRFPVLWSIIGGVLFTAIVVLLTGRRTA